MEHGNEHGNKGNGTAWWGPQELGLLNEHPMGRLKKKKQEKHCSGPSQMTRGTSLTTNYIVHVITDLGNSYWSITIYGLIILIISVPFLRVS